MIRIAAFPKCWLEDLCTGRRNLFDWIEDSARLRCDGLELYGGFLVEDSPSYRAEVRRRIEALGMCMPMMCYSPDFTNPDAAERAQEVRKQKRMIRLTAELGGSFCRTLSGQRRPEVPVAQGTDWVVGCIEECLGEAQSCGVRLVIENHYKDGFWKYPEFAQKKDVFLSILRRVDSPLLGVQYDPSNALVAGDDPVELLRAVLPRVMTMHASDRHLAPGATLEDMRQADGTLGYPKALLHGVMGRGMIDYEAVFRLLRRGGFDGWISIEDGMNGMEEMMESVEFLRTMRAKHFGQEER